MASIVSFAVPLSVQAMSARAFHLWSLASAFVLGTACAAAQPAASNQQLPESNQQPAAPPKLVVLIVVDQLRGDMLDRYRADLSKGYARLMNGGAWYTNAFHDHAITETAPGHASLMSGRFPRGTGIHSNSVGVVDRDYRLLAGTREAGASPERFVGTTLIDWLTSADPRSRAFSASFKDRGAILTVGKSKQQVYWYSTLSGTFTTSNYYRDSVPAWVTDFNNRRIPHQYAGATWNLSRPASMYSAPDSVDFENGGAEFTFPHQFPTDTMRAVSYIQYTPTLDSLTALFALEGLERLGIGNGPQTDVMSVSFSATDRIGHSYGPDSREAHENEIRLDETLGWFLDSLYKLRDPGTVMLALTADHGVSPIPELARARGQATGNEGLRVNLRPVVAAIKSYIGSRRGDSTAVYYDGETFSLDRVPLRRAGIDADSVLTLFARAARQVPGVARVDRMSALRRANLDRDAIARRWVHQIPAEEPIDLVITLTRYSYWNNAISTHGSPYDQDASVPIIFYGPWVKPGRYDTFARTVDIGVTLAAIAGVKPTEKVDGVVLKGAIK
jgi:predicted AlkP superfamily pyrophosphatase or phosphodiesterase